MAVFTFVVPRICDEINFDKNKYNKMYKMMMIPDFHITNSYAEVSTHGNRKAKKCSILVLNRAILIVERQVFPMLILYIVRIHNVTVQHSNFIFFILSSY